MKPIKATMGWHSTVLTAVQYAAGLAIKQASLDTSLERIFRPLMEQLITHSSLQQY